MKAFAVVALSTTALVAEGTAQTLQPATVSRREIMGRVVDMLRWKSYWEGAESFFGYYTVGKVVDTKIVRTTAGITVFMAAAGVNLEFRFGTSGMVGTFGTYMVGQTNDEAAARRLANNCGGLKLKSPASRAASAAGGTLLPVEPVCFDGSARQLAEEDFQYTLPALPAPDYVSTRSGTADGATKLKEVVDRAVREQLAYQNTCKSATVTIPYYSSTDPSVFVYVDMGRGCEEFSGVFNMRHLPDGSWDQPGKLWSVRPPNDWSWTIRQIKRMTLMAYEIR